MEVEKEYCAYFAQGYVSAFAELVANENKWDAGWNSSVPGVIFQSIGWTGCD